MFEIFGAIFGGAYLAGKILGDKNAHRVAEIKYNQQKDIISQITNFGLERKLRKEIYYSNPPEVECGLEELTMEKFMSAKQSVLDKRRLITNERIGKEDMEYVFGKNWSNSIGFLSDNYEILKNPNCYPSDSFCTLWEVVFNIYLSTYGFVETHHAYYGYQYMFDIQYIPHDDRTRVARRACEVIERNVKSKHPNIDGLYLTVGGGSGGDDTCVLQWDFNKRC